MWLTGPERGDVWGELGKVLDLGGRCTDANSFVAPYVFSDWPDDLDAFEHAAITGSRVRMRQAPRDTARVIAFLDFALVRAKGLGDRQSGWVSVDAPDGRKGFVSRRYLTRSSVSRRVSVSFPALIDPTAGPKSSVPFSMRKNRFCTVPT